MTRAKSEPPVEHLRARIVVKGRVQGVGYRSFARRRALSLDLRGWVRNRIDGTVELLVEGERHGVLRFIALLREGSAWARVDDVEAELQEYRGEFTSFAVRG